MYQKTVLSQIQYLKLKAPLYAQFELTKGCNQKCIFCYNVWKEDSLAYSKNSLSKKEHFEILNKLVENEIFGIIFSGGEPLLIKWLEELILKVSQKRIESSLITNGMLLSTKKVESLKQSGLHTIQISLHHHIASVNNFLVGGKSFHKTVLGIKNTIDVFGESNVNINMVVLPDTFEEVYEMAKYLHSIGVKNFSIGTPSVTGEMSKNRNYVINKKAFMNVFSQLQKAKKDFDINVSFTGGFPLCILPKIDDETLNMISNICDAGLNQIVIGPEGNIRPCVCLNHNLGNILTDDIKDIWSKNDILLNLRKLQYLPNECNNCNYIHICRGGCRASAYGYYGKINAIDPLMN